jgi:hypothetical protein
VDLSVCTIVVQQFPDHDRPRLYLHRVGDPLLQKVDRDFLEGGAGAFVERLPVLVVLDPLGVSSEVDMPKTVI